MLYKFCAVHERHTFGVILGSQVISGAVVVYPVIEAYASIAVVDISEVGEVVLGRCRIFCACTSVF